MNPKTGKNTFYSSTASAYLIEPVRHDVRKERRTGLLVVKAGVTGSDNLVVLLRGLIYDSE